MKKLLFLNQSICFSIGLLVFAVTAMGVYSCNSSSGTSGGNSQTGVVPDQGVVNEALQSVITGTNFHTGSRVVMTPIIDGDSRILNSPALAVGGKMARSGDLLVMASREDGLNIADTIDPFSPNIIGHSDLMGRIVSDVFISSDTVYVANWNEGLQMVNIGNPQAPVAMERLAVADNDFRWAQYVRGNQNRVYVAVAGNNPDNSPPYPKDTLYVVDITNAADIKILGAMETPNALYGIEVQDDTLFYVSGSGLVAVNIADPAQMEIIDTLEVGVDLFRLSGQIMFAATGEDKLVAIDINNPRDMRILDEISVPDTSQFWRSIVVNGSQVFLLTISNIWKIDANNPAAMQIAGTAAVSDLPCCSEGLVISNDIAYVSTQNPTATNGLHVVDISDLENPGAKMMGIAGAIVAPNADDLALNGNTMYVAQGTQGVGIYDISDLQYPQRLLDNNIMVSATTLAVNDSILYVGGENSILIYDVSYPQSPRLLSNLELPDQNILQVAVMNHHLVIDSNTCEYDSWLSTDICSNYLRVIDVSDPNFPVLTGTVSISAEYADDLVIFGNLAILATNSSGYLPGLGSVSWSEYFFVDLSDPSRPVVVDSDFTGGSSRIAVAKDILFLLASTQAIPPQTDVQTQLTAFDISNSVPPEQLGELSLPWAKLLSVSTENAYLVYDDRDYQSSYKGIYTVDIRSPQNMKRIGQMILPHSATGAWEIRDMVLADDIACISTAISGIFMLPLPREAKNVTVNSRNRLTVTLPGPKIPGSYILTVFDEYGNYAEYGPVTFNVNDEGTIDSSLAN